MIQDKPPVLGVTKSLVSDPPTNKTKYKNNCMEAWRPVKSKKNEVKYNP